MSAHTPAARGQEKEGPLSACLGFVPLATTTPEPIAMTSGLIRPSTVEPTELKEKRVPSDVTAPTAIHYPHRPALPGCCGLDGYLHCLPN